MGFLERTKRKLFNTPKRHPFFDKSPNLFATPSQTSISKFSLPSSEHSSSSSPSSISSSSSFWTSPAPPSRWSRFLSSSVRNTVSKRQIAVLLCLILALLIWVIPQPQTWRRRVIHITMPPAVANPYQVLRPVSDAPVAKKHASDPMQWLEQNSNNKHAENTGVGLLKSVPSFGHYSAKPRAALISLVRNSELPGLMQSMRQLEFQWNRKYNYPWIFFNDEPFSDEFKVRQGLVLDQDRADKKAGCHTKSYVCQMLLRSSTQRTLVVA